VLVQLAKARSIDDPIVQGFVAEVQRASSGNVYAILQVVFDPTDPTFAAADYVQQSAVTIGAYWAHNKSTGGQEIPPNVKEAYTDAIAQLKETRAGLTSLGTDKEPTSQVQSHQVDMTGRGWTRKSWGGFC
jgi:hypothetical protein